MPCSFSVRCRFIVMPDVTIKLFRFVQNCYQTMGCIHPSNQNRSMNLQNSFFFIPVLLMFLSTTGYIIFEATTILEYAATLYVSATELAIMVHFNLFENRKYPNTID